MSTMRARRTGALGALLWASAMALAPAAGAQDPVDVDLRTWQAAGKEDAGEWDVAEDGLTVTQLFNDEPTFFVAPDVLQPGTVVEGEITVTDPGDDDYIGFVFGLRTPTDLGDEALDLFLFDWKQADQSSTDCAAEEGFTLSRVSGRDDHSQDWQASNHPVFWCHDDADPRLEVLARDTGAGKGWVDGQTYVFTLEYSPTHVRISIDGAVIFDLDGDFPIGRFGFYNYSQAGTVYRGFRQTEAEEQAPIRIDDPSGDVKRVAQLICQYLHTADAAREVVLARDDVFADTLAGAPLAQDDGCILFTPGGRDAPLDPATRAEIDRALPDGAPISILGGEGAVSPLAEAELRAAGYAVTRFRGESRIQTATAVGDELLRRFPGSTTAGLAFFGNWPDAVTGGAWATDARVPILLTDTPTLHPDTQAFLERHGITETVVFGGAGVVSQAAADAAPGARRVSGANRMATAAQVAEVLWGNAGAATLPAIAAVNLELPDAWALALAASPLSAQYDAPQVGVALDRVPAETSAYLEALDYPAPPDVYVIGGTNVIDDATANGVAAAAATP